ncbi:MAG: small ribosomal subunit biogenesis GTPase RsgA [Leptolyngbyaceae bacterium]|nr:small ribosomal subunit biogenesis GTPase RsgA [Leptolyngbyaceae bacterium]
MTDEHQGIQQAARPISINTSQRLIGTVLATQANYYRVKLDTVPQDSGQNTSSVDLESGLLLCTRRARLKKIRQAVCVGDRVIIEEPDWADRRGAIADVLDRRTELDRPPVANADQVFLLFALAQPDPDPIQFSRFLVKAESTQMSVFVGLNKADLVSPEMAKMWGDRIATWGYSPIALSLKKNTSFEPVYARLQNHMTVVSGPSGTGKSSLLNALIADIDLPVGSVSGKLGRGRHTTRHVELFSLPEGGLLADTPGFNQPDIDMSPTDLAQCFPEIRHRLAQGTCQFSDCLHRDEPNCVVRGDWERYEHYLSFLDDAIAHQDQLKHRGDDESGYKVKIGEDGEEQLEPKLEAKRYRKPSRRSQRQDLQRLCGDLDDLMTDTED